MKDEAVLLQNDIEPVYEIYCSRCKINYCTGGKTLYEAAQIMADVGWRRIGKRTMCPDCAKSNVHVNRPSMARGESYE